MSYELNSDLQDINFLPLHQELIGFYKIDEISFDYSISDKFRSSQLILKTDGSLELNNFPTKVFSNVSYDDESYLSSNSKGVWEASEFNGKKVISIHINFGGKFNQIKDKTNWTLYTLNDKIVLYYLFGDIDACSAVRLIKN